MTAASSANWNQWMGFNNNNNNNDNNNGLIVSATSPGFKSEFLNNEKLCTIQIKK